MGANLLLGQNLPKTAWNEENWTKGMGSKFYYVDPLSLLYFHRIPTLSKKWKKCLAISVADPGFPRGGDANPPGGQHTILTNFPKIAWNWKNLDPVGRPSSPLRSATAYVPVWEILDPHCPLWKNTSTTAPGSAAQNPSKDKWYKYRYSLTHLDLNFEGLKSATKYPILYSHVEL